jgi:hypothetical protein
MAGFLKIFGLCENLLFFFMDSFKPLGRMEEAMFSQVILFLYTYFLELLQEKVFSKLLMCMGICLNLFWAFCCGYKEDALKWDFSPKLKTTTNMWLSTCGFLKISVGRIKILMW